MKKHIIASGLTVLLALAAQAQITQPTIPPGKIAVFKAGTSDNSWPMVTARVAPCFLQVFDPAITNQSSTNALVSVAMSTNVNVPGSVWINHHAGSEGGGLSRSTDRRYLALEGYTGNILSPTAAKPSTDPTVYRGIVRLDAFTNAVSIYSDLANWFGIPAGSGPGTQDNPTGIASTDGTNFWGTGNFAPVGANSGELDGTLFFNSIEGPPPSEVQNFIQGAAEARIIGGTLYVACMSGKGAPPGIYNFVNPATQTVVPLPFDPSVPNPYQTASFTNLYINWGSTFQTIANFDMNPSATVAYGADQTYGIVKFTNNGGTWMQAPYYFSTTNLGTTAQSSGNQGCFGICVDFSGTNPVIYATTMENGAPTNYAGGFGVNTKQGHQNNNRLIEIVDTGVNPGTNYVATTLAVAATTNEFFGGIDFTPDLRPLITSNPANYATTNGGSASFNVTAESVYALSYQWLQNGTNLNTATNATLILTNLNSTFSNYTYQCVVTNNYGMVTSTPAILTVTLNPVAPQITSGTNHVTGFVSGATTFAAVSATGTQPFSYQWYYGTNALADGANPNGSGSGYSGSQTSSLTVTNLQITDAGNYYVVVGNPSVFYASNLVDVLTVNYHLATIGAGQPQSVITFVGTPTLLTASEAGATPPVTNQWYQGTNMLTDNSEFTGTGSSTLNIAATTTNDTAANYYIVVSNPGGSVTSSLASVTVMVPPPHSYVSYTNQIYLKTFDALPDPGGVSVNSINNPKDPGTISGVAYSLANPFDFAYPVITTSYVGGLGFSTGATNMNGWYGAADTNTADAGSPDGITRFGAQPGDQSTGGVIDFGPNDVNGGILGTNRALGLLSTSTTGSTAFGLKLINNSTNTLNYINLRFIGEFWRNNKAARTMSFSYAIDPTATNFVLVSQPTATNTLPQDIPNTISVPNLAFGFLTNDGSILAMDGTQPTNQVNMITNNMALSSPWQPGAALWLIWSINYYGQGTGQGYAIDNLSFSATTTPTTPPAVTNTAATKITASSAQLNAIVNPDNGATAYWFQYGTNTSYGKFTPTNTLAVVSGPVSVANVVTGLLQGTVYHYQIVATNLAGTSLATDTNFSTLVVTPPNLGGTAFKAGAFRLAFTNATGASFSVLATNNLTSPITNWPVVGHAVESPAGSGNYQFTNSPATNVQFYFLRQP